MRPSDVEQAFFLKRIHDTLDMIEKHLEAHPEVKTITFPIDLGHSLIVPLELPNSHAKYILSPLKSIVSHTLEEMGVELGSEIQDDTVSTDSQ